MLFGCLHTVSLRCIHILAWDSTRGIYMANCKAINFVSSKLHLQTILSLVILIGLGHGQFKILKLWSFTIHNLLIQNTLSLRAYQHPALHT